MPFAIPVFCHRFFLPYRFTGDCDYSNKYGRFSIVNNALHNITTQLKYYQRWLRDGSRWQREQAQASNIIIIRLLSAGEGGSKAGGDSGAVGGSGSGSFAAHGCRGQVLEKRIILQNPYGFGYRSVIVLGFVVPTFFCMFKLRCSVTRKGRQGGQAASGSSQTADCIRRIYANEYTHMYIYIYDICTCIYMYIYMYNVCMYIFKYAIWCISLSYSVDVLVFFLPYRFTMVWTCF